jgi:hypothetical protein
MTDIRIGDNFVKLEHGLVNQVIVQVEKQPHAKIVRADINTKDGALYILVEAKDRWDMDPDVAEASKIDPMAVALVTLKNKAGQRGLYRTMHAFDAVTEALGRDLAPGYAAAKEGWSEKKEGGNPNFLENQFANPTKEMHERCIHSGSAELCKDCLGSRCKYSGKSVKMIKQLYWGKKNEKDKREIEVKKETATD